MVMSLAQDGSGFPFFGSCVYDYICGKDMNNIEMESVPDDEAYLLLCKVRVHDMFIFYL